MISKKLMLAVVDAIEDNLKKPKTISIKSGGVNRVFIERINGELKLKLIPPITLKIKPPPNDNDQIIWGGKNYLPKNIKDGIYTFDQDSNKPAVTENDLPD